VPAEITVVWDDAAIKIDCESESSAVGHGMSQMADQLVSVMKQLCPVSPAGSPGHPSGTLRSSIQKFRQGDGSYLVGPTATTENGELLGPMIEKGTPPHIIRSKGPWPLRNVQTGDVFGPVVNHPGTEAQPFIAPAAESMSGYTVDVR
jgi:hypothetical protein